MAAGSKVAQIVFDMALPLAEKEDLTVYEVEFKKEGSDYVLRVVLDTTNDDQTVSLTSCENVSRALSELLDANDPTDTPYMLEVTSPGLDRPLKKDEDFRRFAGRDVEIGLYKQLNGTKQIAGTLVSLDDGVITVTADGEEVKIDKSDTSFVRLAVVF